MRSLPITAVVTVLLLGLLGVWAVQQYRNFHDRHVEEMRLRAGNTARTMQVVLQSLEPLDQVREGQLQEIVRSMVADAPWLYYLQVRTPGAVLAQAPTDAKVADISQSPQGEATHGEVLQIWGPVQLPSPLVNGPRRQQRRQGLDEPSGPPAGNGFGEGPPFGPPGQQRFGGPPWRRGNGEALPTESAETSVPPTPTHPPATIIMGLEGHMPKDALARALMGLSLRVGGGLIAVFLLAVALTLSQRRRQLEHALSTEKRERDHLEELRVAAAGLAHETKNPLGLISGLAQRIAAECEALPEVEGMAEQIIDESERAAVRLGEFIHYARHPEPVLAEVSLEEVFRRIRAVVGPEFEVAEVNLRIPHSVVHIRADADMLSQALLNLLLNSLSATPAGGKVLIALELRGDDLELAVQDNGRGVPAGLLPNLGKPYVTARPDGHGLGLAIVRRIASRHGWHMSISSQEGVGTEVRLAGIAVLPDTDTLPPLEPPSDPV